MLSNSLLFKWEVSDARAQPATALLYWSSLWVDNHTWLAFSPLARVIMKCVRAGWGGGGEGASANLSNNNPDKLCLSDQSVRLRNRALKQQSRAELVTSEKPGWTEAQLPDSRPGFNQGRTGQWISNTTVQHWRTLQWSEHRPVEMRAARLSEALGSGQRCNDAKDSKIHCLHA